MTRVMSFEQALFKVGGEVYSYNLPYLVNTEDAVAAVGQKCHRANIELDLERPKKAVKKIARSFTHL